MAIRAVAIAAIGWPALLFSADQPVGSPHTSVESRVIPVAPADSTKPETKTGESQAQSTEPTKGEATAQSRPSLLSETTPRKPMPEMSVEIGWGKPILALLFVFGTMAAILWLLKKSKAIQTMPKGLLKRIAVLPLTNKESIAVVECRDTWLVVGVTVNQITLLHTLPREVLSPHDETPNIPFATWLDSTMSRFRSAQDKPADRS